MAPDLGPLCSIGGYSFCSFELLLRFAVLRRQHRIRQRHQGRTFKLLKAMPVHIAERHRRASSYLSFDDFVST
jgi:hypothetical protein